MKKAKPQDKSIKTFVGARISDKQMKLFLAKAKSGAERRAIKQFCLGEPLKFYAKNVDAEEKVVIE